MAGREKGRKRKSIQHFINKDKSMTFHSGGGKYRKKETEQWRTFDYMICSGVRVWIKKQQRCY